MEPPTCSVVVRVVRTTGAVATGLLPPGDEAVLPLLSLTAAATPPATIAPTRAPAMAALPMTCLAANSAIDAWPGCARLGDVSGARIYLLKDTCRCRRGIERGSGGANLDGSGRARAVNPPGWRAYLLPAQLVGFLEGRAIGVHAAADEVGCVPGGVRVVGDPVGPHAVDVLQLLGLIRRRRFGIGGLQLVLGPGQVLAARAGELMEISGRLRISRDDDPDHPGGIDGRVGLIWITVAALAGGPLVQQRGHIGVRSVPGARRASGGPGVPGGGGGSGGSAAGVSQAGDLGGSGPAGARGQREGGRRDKDREHGRPPVRPCHAPGPSCMVTFH